MFPAELVQDAFRANNGEFGWTRAQIPLVVDILRRHKLGILGGEVWWVRDGIGDDWTGLVPQHSGNPGVYPWETNRLSGEPWLQFVERGAADSLVAVALMPRPGELPPDLTGKVLYNLTWVSEAEYEQLALAKVLDNLTR